MPFAKPVAFLLLLGLPFLMQAQPVGDEGQVRRLIEGLFDAMRQADSASLRAMMHPDLRMLTVTPDESGESRLRMGSLSAWLKSVADAEPGTLDERIWSYAIRVDGDLATAWTPYTFFLRGEPHHCGANAFQLVRTDGGWKIFQVTDTRRQGPCMTRDEGWQAELDQFIDGWHAAAARADEDAFFGAMTADALYIGTDPGERWLRDELRAWAQDAFDRDSAWAFTALERHLRLAPDGSTAWWVEKLDTWMGPCWATGVARRQQEGWKIEHYQLSVALPNEKMPAYLDLIGQ